MASQIEARDLTKGPPTLLLSLRQVYHRPLRTILRPQVVQIILNLRGCGRLLFTARTGVSEALDGMD